MTWGVIRNVPFAALGVVIICLFFKRNRGLSPLFLLSFDKRDSKGVAKRSCESFCSPGFFVTGRVRGGVSKHETRCAKKESRQVRQPFIPILIQFGMRGLFMLKILYLKQINSVDM